MMNELAKIESTDLQAFGGRDPIKEIAARLQIMMPNAQKLTQPEAMAVAQVAFAHGLDPFNGEVWGIKGNNEWYGVMVGIKGLRKGAKREADKQGGVYWFEEPKQVDPKKYNVDKPNAICYEMVLRDSVTTQAWAKTLNMMTTSGVPYAEAVQMLGKSPCTVGVGIADPSERSKMGLHARAKKRAEADALKVRYSLEFGGAVTGVDETPVTDATATVSTYDEDFKLPAAHVEELPDVDEVFPPEPPARPVETVIGELMGEPAKPAPAPATNDIDYVAEHKALWREAQEAGLLNNDTIKAWAVRSNAPAELVAEKCAAIRAALGK